MGIEDKTMNHQPKDSADKFSCSILRLLYNWKLYETDDPNSNLELMDFMMERFSFRMENKTKSGRSFEILKVLDVQD